MTRRTVLAAALILAWSGPVLAQASAEWNVYVYMNAQPNLDEPALRDLEEIKQAGASPDVNVFVQLALSNQQVRRFQIHQGEIRLLEDLGAINLFDSRNLADFVIWAHSQFPAKRHCVVVWGHGTALPQLQSSSIGRYPPLVVPTPGMDLHLLRESATRIRQALGKPVDVWGYDSCFMQRVEVGYELRNSSRYLVASQDTIDTDGWDYVAWLSFLLDRPSIEGSELALAITRMSAISSSGEERQIACVDLAHYHNLASAISSLGRELARFRSDRGRMATLVTAHYRARRYVGEDGESSAYVDLQDLAALFSSAEFPRPLAAAARRVQTAVQGAVLLRFGDSRSTGISILHQIQPQLSSDYRTLDFSRDTSWDEYLSGRRRLPQDRPTGWIYRTSVAEPIPDDDAQGLSSLVSVGETGTLRSVRLFLNIRHEYVGDLKVTLTAPSGRQATVMNRVGGNAQNLRGWVGSEEVSRLFQGELLQGDWQLHVADLNPEDQGQLLAWRLELVPQEIELLPEQPSRGQP